MKNKVLVNMLWRFAERCGAQGVAFVVSVILARLLDPSVYGTIALVTVFTAILNVFIDSGFGSALVQKKDADDLDFSTVFYFNIVVCVLLYVIMFFSAPFIAEFYKDASLVPIIRVLSLTLIISGIKNVQQAYVSRTLQFKRFFFATLGGTVGAAIIGITLAYTGFGVWALVIQQLFNALVDTIILWCTVRWRPKKKFSLERLKGLFSYGWKLLVSALLDTGYNNVRQLIIGRLYTSADLGYYNKGKQFPNLIITNVNTAIDSVIFPVISSKQNNISEVKRFTRQAIKVSSFVIWPVVIGLAASAETVVRLLLTDKWLPCVSYLQIFCIVYGFWPIHTANLNAIKAVGRSDIFLKLEIIKKTIGVISIIVSMPFGVMPMALAYLATSPISAIVNATPNRKLLGYKYTEQLQDILPSLLISLIMGVCVLLIGMLQVNLILVLLLQVVSGAVIYIVLSKIFRLDAFEYILGIAKQYFVKAKKH